jgi:hypothetical protein
MHPSDQAALLERVLGAVTEAVADLCRDNPHADFDEAYDSIADAVMEIIEPIANERDDLRAKLAAAYEAIRWADTYAEDAIDWQDFWSTNPAVQRAKEAKP